MLQRAARNAYSWWWASHIRTKQSKWLDQNIIDMQEKVEYILKIIEQDGDSFAQRAEMYYRKRPELVNFVEDSFRGYRALAERYDHLSRELQTANRTIATVYPEQVQLAMEDEDEESFPAMTSIPPCDPQKCPKNLPAAPKLDIPKNPKIPLKSSKDPDRSISKKGLLKMSVPTNATDTNLGAGITKGLEEIDKLQKSILALQTEKEFVKSLYESGVAKYWEIEEKVTEMQAKVNDLQDEFGIGTFIEDDEARTLMAATALKSCQEALIQLQEKQEHLNEEARAEHQRIKEAHEKLEILKGNSGNKKCLSENLECASISVDLRDSEQESHDVELLREKIKEQLKVDSSTSLTMSEFAEKIDDLVDKVITLETAVSSQNALVKRLRSETSEIQANLRSMEEDKEALIEGLDSKSNKIRELEQELVRIQSLHQNVNQQNRNLQIHVTEANFSVDLLSEKLETVKQDEEGDNPNNHLVNLSSTGHDSAVSQDVETGEKAKKDDTLVQSASFRIEDDNFVVSNLSSHVGDVLLPVEGRDDYPDHKNPFKAEQEFSFQLNPLEHVENLSVNGQVEAALGTNPFDDDPRKGQVIEDQEVDKERTLKEHEGVTGPSNDSVISNDAIMEQKNNEDMVDPGNNSLITKDAKATKEAMKDESNPSKLESREVETEDESQPDWRQLFMNGLDDRETMLLQQYTTILRNFKETKKRLSEMEKKNHDSLFKSTSQIKELKNSNALKDAEIRSLHKKLKLLQTCLEETLDTEQEGPVESVTSEETDQKAVSDLLDGQKVESPESKEASNEPESINFPGKGEGKKKAVSCVEPCVLSRVEEKIRSDIDGLLEENIEFWLRFSTSVHQIQKFQNSVRDLEEELAKVMETKKQDGSSKRHSLNSDVRPIYTHLREIQTELAMWLEHNSLIEDELQNRLSSLSSIQEEISRLSKAGLKGEEEESELSDYEAAKFQGEVLNMKQENNKVVYKFQAGLERVKELQGEITKILENLEEELGISSGTKNRPSKNSSSRRIPLRSFLFGVRLRKQSASLFQCMSPSLQKQYSDLTSMPPPT
ncbi:hypothetical protein ACSBR2_029427 [Camellia fascicularis]